MENAKESHELNLLLSEEGNNQNGKQNVGTSQHSVNSTLPKSAQGNAISKKAPAKLFRQTYMLVLVSLYSCLAIFAWTIICVQNKRPITTHTYEYVDNGDDYHGVLADQMKRNSEWLSAVKVLLSVTNTLVLPLTSTVCASAAVIYVQNFGRRRRFSMQHTSTLADDGWTSPHVWLALLSIKGWRSRGSYFLVFAMVFHALGTICPVSRWCITDTKLTLIGLVIGPLQQYFIGQESFKFQTVQTPGLQEGADVYDFFRDGITGDNQLQTARLRSELATVSGNDYQPE